jgi:hypothetical protein
MQHKKKLEVLNRKRFLHGRKNIEFNMTGKQNKIFITCAAATTLKRARGGRDFRKGVGGGGGGGQSRKK